MQQDIFNLGKKASELITAARTLIVSANETQPTNPPAGSVDEAQAESIANLELVLRHLEDAAYRCLEAAHAFGPDASSTVKGSGDAQTTTEEASGDDEEPAA